jgi:putative Mg2+ transporter-C (MgtC) family protein
MDLTIAALLSRLGLSALLGVLIGLDREHLRKPAGVRTMMMVSVGAALFTIVGLSVSGIGGAVNTDALSRVIQGIVGGVGFLGAGVVMRDRGRVRGVTTAAGIWVTAGVGAACGLGEYALAGVAAALIIATFTSSRFVFHGEEGANGAPAAPASDSMDEIEDPPRVV